MVFIIGGSYQGKQEFVHSHFGLTDSDHFICTEDTREIDFSRHVIVHIERFALGCIHRGEEPKDYWMSHLDELKDHILISDDVSCGIVPMDPIIRAWREATGRANNALAASADEVWRVFCGLGQRLK